MRFLADMGVSLTSVQALRGLITTRSTSVMKTRSGFPDRRESRDGAGIVLTFDLDFGDILAVTRGEAPSVIIFRMRNQTPAAGESATLSSNRRVRGGTRKRRHRYRRE